MHNEPLVDAIGQQQRLNALLAEDLEMGAVFGSCETLGCEVIDFLLTFFHATDIICQRNVLFLLVRMRRGKTQKSRDLLAIGRILDYTFLQNLAELLPESGLFVGLFLAQVFKQTEYFLDRGGTNGIDGFAVLEDFA